MTDPEPGAEDDRYERLPALHDRLEATADLPLETRANRWLGEAEAVAADALRAAEDDAPAAAIDRRVRQVQELLEHVEGTGNEDADEHVAAARALAERILDRT